MLFRRALWHCFCLFGIVLSNDLLTFTRGFAADWTCWRGPDQNGFSADSNWLDVWPSEGPQILWKAQVGTGFSSMVVSNNRLYTIGNTDDQDSIFCLDAMTGGVLWTHSYACPLDDRFFEGGPTSTPTVDGNSLFVLSRTGDIMSLQADTGVVQWSKNLPNELSVEVPGWGFAGSPVIFGDQLILSVGQSGTSLDKATGEVQWHSEGEAGYMTPYLMRNDQGSLIVIASGKFFHGVNLKTGEVIWRHRWLTTFGCNASDPIEDKGRLFISSGYNRGSALLDLTGEKPVAIWETKDFQNQWSSSILLDGFLYGVDGNDTAERSLKCIELETGSVRWSFVGLGSASLFAAGKKLIVLSDQGELVVAGASPDGFQPTARAQILTGKCWTVPVLANGLIYCRNASGEIVCADVRKQ